jgi:hypothetical protein
MTSVLFAVFLSLQVRVVPREISGRVSVEGDALAPSSFALALTPGMPLTIRPQIDGTFRALLPPGEYRIGAPLNLPAGYAIKSIAYGTTDLLKSPLTVSSDNAAELRIELAVDGPPRTVSVSGRVTGIVPGQVHRIALREPTAPYLAAALEAPVGADGTFTFPKVFPGNYIIYLKLRAQTRISVGDKDVTGVTVAYPSDILVSGHVIVEGAQTIPPDIVIEGKRAAPPNRATGTFVLSLDNGENTISVRNIPETHRLKSLTYGDVDLLKNPLVLDGPALWDIIVRLAPKN